MARVLVAVVLAMPFAGFGGCGPSLPKTAPVSGRVMLDDKPLAGGVVAFVADGAFRFGSGRTDESGRFTLTTFVPGDGAVLGEHRVTVIPAPAPAASAAAEGGLPSPDEYATVLRQQTEALERSRIPRKYMQPETSPLRAVVKPGPNEFRFELDRK